MKSILKKIAVLVVVLVFASSSIIALAATWYTTDQWGSWSNGGYTLYNDVWGAGAGPQTLWANSYSNWGVWANHPNTGGVKSYPNSTKYVGRTLDSLSYCTSSYDVTRPSSGAYETSYDIWDSTNWHEIMLWVNSVGFGSGVKPISDVYNAQGQAVVKYPNVTVGNISWDVYYGHRYGGGPVYTFVKKSQSNSGSVDVKAAANFIRSKGYFGNITLGSVQFGFEITSSSGGMNFNCNSYGVYYQ